MLEPVLDAVPPVRRCAGRSRRRPVKLHADKGYGYARCRRAVRYERRADLLDPFHRLAAALIHLRFAKRWFC